MSLWTLNNPPKFKNPKGKELVATERGWEDPDTGEVLVAISELDTKAGAADIVAVSFGKLVYARGEAITVTVRFNERVDVVAGLPIEVASTGAAGNFFLHALAHAAKNEILFSLAADLLTPVVVADEAAMLSIAAQTLSGDVKDAGKTIASNLVVSGEVAEAAGTREIV